ncbi:glycoside hydrolase family 53 protein [Winogradskyella bathintestinalis]|uniref:Arabinogalactan endo-beta-1,4-galactanase n=1 Tax=Winogradskyella bathintestinalis TaxID=3035208 RepID=A0ABT7ZUD3_9FLAO|nr:glycosyl hydrolase 53 family protein [Winogradskyella bathintestinalis]MDN3492618.1 glycosyl hydrolase 53 family protein [Winogradskyella bathintestinalis]
MKLLQYIFIIALIALTSCSKNDNSDHNNDVDDDQEQKTFYAGMDLSFQSELENYNIDYKDAEGNSIELLDFVKSKGTNLVRLKLWHSPQNGENGLEDIKAYAQRVKSKNMNFLLNFHYSDYWADPGTQTPPSAWQNLSLTDLKVAVYNYTKNVIGQLKSQHTLPDIIQIGNEIDNGFLWDYGKVWNAFDGNWVNYTSLVSEAIRAVREMDTENEIKIMLHHSNVENSIYFFYNLQTFNLDFDIIGLSYYPQFQTKDLNLVASKLNNLANRFNKDILMVEVAYPFTLEWNDNLTNYIGSTNQTILEFAPTPQGQKAYMEWLITTIRNIPNDKGIGFCYWPQTGSLLTATKVQPPTVHLGRINAYSIST